MKAWRIVGLIVVCCSIEAWAQTAVQTPGWHGTLGAGAMFAPKYVGGKELETLPLPIAYVDYNDWFYVNLFRAGAYGWSSDDRKMGISFALEPRAGFRSSDGPRLIGMATRHSTLLGGPTFDWEGELGSLSVGYFFDLTSTSHGGYLDVLFSKPLVKNERWEVNGTIELTRLDSKIVNYYFGVRPAEVTPTRPLYQPGATTNATLWLTGQYNLTPRYALMFGANVTQLGKAAADSPIVERRRAPLFYLGLGLNL
jgi:outer membrane protein